MARLVTHSSGNHGTALAWAAQALGTPCTVVVPEGCPEVKCRSIQAYGAELVFCKQTPSAREEAAERIIQEQGGVLIPSSNHPDVISGQGTLALELLEQVPDLDLVLVPISGGGMAAGVAVAVKAIRPQCKVMAVEPVGKCLEQSLEAKKRLWRNPPAYLRTKAGNSSARSSMIAKVTVNPTTTIPHKQTLFWIITSPPRQRQHKVKLKAGIGQDCVYI